MNTKMIKIASAAAGAAIVAGLAFAGVASAQTPGPSQTPVPGRGPMRDTPPTGAPAYGRGQMQSAPANGQRGGRMAEQGYGMGGWGGSQVSMVSAAADKLGMTVADLTAELKTGKTIAAVAEAKKVAPSAIVDAMLAPRKAQLDTQVTAGRLTREQADTMLAQMRATITPKLSEPWTANGPGNGVPGSAFVDKDGDGECDQMPEGGRQQAPAGGRGMQRGPRMGR